MNKILIAALLVLAAFTGCVEQTEEKTATEKMTETQVLDPLSYSVEREMLIKWYGIVNDPYNVQWVYQFSEGTGQLIFKSPVVGKVVSMRKGLGPKTRYGRNNEYAREGNEGQALFGAKEGTPELMNPSGTYGSDLDGVFFFTPEGQYLELHGGIIIVSDQPISVTEPVMNINSINEEDTKKEVEYEKLLKNDTYNPLR